MAGNGPLIHRFGFSFDSEQEAELFAKSCRASLAVLLADHFGSVAYAWTRSTVQFQSWLLFEWPDVFNKPRSYKSLSYW